MSVVFHPANEPMPWNVWVLGYWPHLDRPWNRQRKSRNRYGGWHPTRRREWGWTVWSKAYAWRMPYGPACWTPILEPTPLPPEPPGVIAEEIECLERLMRDRFGGTKIDCPSCAAGGVQFHKVRGRRVYACPKCLFQIAPTAGTVLHDTRTPLASWFYAAELLNVCPAMSAKELQRRLGVTYKCAWRMRSKLASVD